MCKNVGNGTLQKNITVNSLVDSTFKKTANIKMKKNQNLWIDKRTVSDRKKQVLNFILIDTEILLVKFGNNQF
jgi:hypothetical protein